MSVLGDWGGAWLRQRSPTRQVAAWVLAVGGPTLLTLAVLAWQSVLVLGGFLFSMMLVVMVVAVIGGTWPALASVALGVFTREFIIAAPYANLGIDPRPNAVSLVGFAVVGAAVAILIGKLAHLCDQQALSVRIEAALRRVATLVARGAPAQQVFAAVTEEAGQLLETDQTRMIRYGSGGTSTVVASWTSIGKAVPPIGAPEPLGNNDLATIILQTRRPARIDRYVDACGAAAAAGGAAAFRPAAGAPIIVEGRVWGAMIVCSVGEHPLPVDTEARLASFTELVATAISNAENLAELTASRARVVVAADETRRRIERDLHDGAQQQLVSLALALRGVQAAIPPGLGDLSGKLADVAEGLVQVMDDLREMARGIHPAILSEGGLAPALKMLARRSTVPVQMDVQADARLPEGVEVAAYYVVSEALTNAAKHAHASVVHVSAATTGHALHLDIRDDGTGGADPVRGSGLIGLKDRVEALGGTITVYSPVGAGTSLHAKLPLAD